MMTTTELLVLVSQDDKLIGFPKEEKDNDTGLRYVTFAAEQPMHQPTKPVPNSSGGIDLVPDGAPVPVLLGSGALSSPPAGYTFADLGRPDGLREERITFEEWVGRYRTAAAVALAASDGDPSARTGPGKLARGLYGLDPVKFGKVPDADADNPQWATRAVFVITNRFADWSAFTTGPGRAGLDPQSPESAEVKAADDARLGTVVDDTFSFISDLLPDWATALAKLLGTLITPDFWRRVGIGALGVLLLVLALVLTIAPTAERAIS